MLKEGNRSLLRKFRVIQIFIKTMNQRIYTILKLKLTTTQILLAMSLLFHEHNHRTNILDTGKGGNKGTERKI